MSNTPAPNPAVMREFATGATRDTDNGKLDYEGFLAPAVLRRFAQYMHKNRYQTDGQVRDSDNWQKGIPQDAYMKSGWRHFMDWWMLHRDVDGISDTAYDDMLEDSLCAIIFNAQGYLFEHLKMKRQRSLPTPMPTPEPAPAQTSLFDNILSGYDVKASPFVPPGKVFSAMPL